jgi:hypothetical protein
MKKFIAALTILAASAGAAHAKDISKFCHISSERGTGSVYVLDKGDSFNVYNPVLVKSGDFIPDFKSGKLNAQGSSTESVLRFWTSHTMYMIYINDMPVTIDNCVPSKIKIIEEKTTQSETPNISTPSISNAPKLPEGHSKAFEGTHYYCENGEKAILSTDKRKLFVAFNEKETDIFNLLKKQTLADGTEYGNANNGAQIYKQMGDSIIINFGHGYDTQCTLSREDK